MKMIPVLIRLAFAGLASAVLLAAPQRPPVPPRDGMVVSQSAIASRVGAEVLEAGGNAMDAAVATAFALAVTHPAAGNLGGGGFLLWRSAGGEAVAYDFREVAPALATETMFLREGRYDAHRHHESHLAVGVPGTVAGLHLAWTEEGRLPWKRLVEPAIRLARDGFEVSEELARSLELALPRLARSPAAFAQFTRQGQPYVAGDRLRQPNLARTLELIARRGPRGFYEGPVARLLAAEMRRHGGLVTLEDLRSYAATRRNPVRGTYRGCEVISMPPPSSGGVTLIQLLNVLEGFDLATAGFGSPESVHRMAEAMRRAFADRARYLGDPDFNRDLPLSRLLSKEHAAAQRASIHPVRASVSATNRFSWMPAEGLDTTHLSVVDAARNAVALTYTLEQSYGSAWMAPGSGFLLNNEMGDFNPAPGLTTPQGLIGTPPNLVAPRKRMLSSMSPTLVTKDGRIVCVLGSPGGRTIINTVMEVLVNLLDHRMSLQAAVDAPRFHHQWLPDEVVYEQDGLSPSTLGLLRAQGHVLRCLPDPQGAVAAIWIDPVTGRLEGAWDRRGRDGAAVRAVR